jgi:hypothetical protein
MSTTTLPAKRSVSSTATKASGSKSPKGEADQIPTCIHSLT